MTFKQSQLGLGKPFKCRKCESELVIGKNFWIPMGGWLAFFRLKSYADNWQETAVIIAIIAVLMLILPKNVHAGAPL